MDHTHTSKAHGHSKVASEHSFLLFASVLVLSAAVSLYAFSHKMPSVDSTASSRSADVVTQASNLVKPIRITKNLSQEALADQAEVSAAVMAEDITDSAGKILPLQKLFISGGLGIGSAYSDLYKSSDGTSWNTSPQNTTAWGPRHVHSMVYLKNKIWVLSGNAAAPKEVWGYDGAIWTHPIDIPSYAGVVNGSNSVVYGGKIYMLGGMGSNGSSNSTNEVWTYDGSDWEQKPNAPWSPRIYAHAVVYQNQLWMLGGYTLNGDNEVWSYDGTTWTQHGTIPWISPTVKAVNDSQALVVFNDGTGAKIYVLGGADGFGVTNNNVWTFDGTNWAQKTNASWPARGGAEAYTLNEKLFIAGGWDFPTTSYFNDIWSTTNGTTWQQEATNSTWSPRGNFAIAKTPQFFGQKPDLIITSFTYSPNPIHQGDIANPPYPMLNFFVKNNSKVNAYIPESLVLSIYNGTTRVADVVYDRETFIKAGGTKKFSGQIRWIQNLTAAGSPYNLTLKVDDANVLDEAAENNNTLQLVNFIVLP